MDWNGKYEAFVVAIDEVTVLAVAATGSCPAVIPDNPPLPPAY
jgi:hypothetical protein